MNPTMYLFLNQGLNMSVGKAGAQAGHAAVEAYRLSTPMHPNEIEDNPLVKAWYVGRHYKKIVFAARDEQHLLTIDRYLRDRGFKTDLIIDEGLTEVPRHTITALGVELVDKDDPHVAATFSSFKTYREKKVEPQSRRKRFPVGYFARWATRKAQRP